MTISPLQRTWATLSAKLRRTGGEVRFEWADAESYHVEPESLDIMWSIECTEHLFQKAQFLRRAAGWLRPGGRMAICAWLAGETNGDRLREQQVREVCQGFLCPSLGTSQNYVSWLENAGLKVTVTRDWTANVMQTWEICRRRVARTGLTRFAPWIDRDAVLFLSHFDTILEAYRSGAMKYGCFIAEKPLRDATASNAHANSVNE